MTWFYFFCCDLYQTSMSPHVQWNMICGTSLQHHNASFLMVCCDMLWQVCDTFLLYNCSSNDLDFALDYVAIPQNILINTVAKKAYYNAYNRAGVFFPHRLQSKTQFGMQQYNPFSPDPNSVTSAQGVILYRWNTTVPLCPIFKIYKPYCKDLIWIISG